MVNKVKHRKLYITCVTFKYISIILLTTIVTAVITYYATRSTCPKPDNVNNITLKNELIDNIFKYGIPSNETYYNSKSYLLSYNNVLKVANWGYEYVDKKKLTKTVDQPIRDNCDFRVDSRIDEYFRSKDSDYKNSGLTRGHIVPAGNHKDSKQNYCATYLLSNISPQYYEFNTGIWNKIEKFIRSNIIDRNLKAYIATGTIFKNKIGEKKVEYNFIGDSQVAIPKQFFKVALFECPNNRITTMSFIAPNIPNISNSNIESYLTRMENVEKLSGNKFFSKLKSTPKQLLSLNKDPCY